MKWRKVFRDGKILSLAKANDIRILSHCPKGNMTHASHPEAMLICGTDRAPELIDVIEPEPKL